MKETLVPNSDAGMLKGKKNAEWQGLERNHDAAVTLLGTSSAAPNTMTNQSSADRGKIT